MENIAVNLGMSLVPHLPFSPKDSSNNEEGDNYKLHLESCKITCYLFTPLIDYQEALPMNKTELWATLLHISLHLPRVGLPWP